MIKRAQSNLVLFEAFTLDYSLVNKALCLANGMVINILYPFPFLSVQEKVIYSTAPELS